MKIRACLWSAAVGVGLSVASFGPSTASACTQIGECECNSIPGLSHGDESVARAKVLARSGGELELEITKSIAGAPGTSVGERIRVNGHAICEAAVSYAVGEDVLVVYKPESLLPLDAGVMSTADAGAEGVDASISLEPLPGSALVHPWDSLPFPSEEAVYLRDFDTCQEHFTSKSPGPAPCRGSKEEDDGCSVTAPGSGAPDSSAWALIVGALVGLRLRRRRRPGNARAKLPGRFSVSERLRSLQRVGPA